MIKRLLEWVDTINTANVRILTTLVLVVGTAVRYLTWGVPANAHEFTVPGLPWLDAWNSWLMFLAVLAGVDVAQYVGKRFSAKEYVSAKNPAQNVTIEAPAVTPLAAPPSTQTVNVNAPAPITPPPPLAVPRELRAPVDLLGDDHEGGDK